MTTSLRALARCVGRDGEVSVKRHLLPAATLGRPFNGRPGLGALAGTVSLGRVMRALDWQWCGGGSYLKAPVPVELRSPSYEEAQILVDGVVEKVTLFMGKSDWELDWHIYPRLDPAVRAMLEQVGRLRGSLFSEVMVVDRWRDEIFGRQWWSSDLDGILLLRWPVEHPRDGAETASEHWSLVEDDHQGGSAEVVADIDDPRTSRNAAIVGGRVYLQGAFVTDLPTDDDGHNHLEIHPLDSVAFARDTGGAVLTARGTEAEWPRTGVDWRVAVLANSGFHRINECSYMKKGRRTVWYLDLPTTAGLPTVSVRVTEGRPGFWHATSNSRYTQRGVAQVTVTPPADGQPRAATAFPVDPSDGRHKLRVEVTMEEPDDWGGLFLRDYQVRAGAIIA